MKNNKPTTVGDLLRKAVGLSPAGSSCCGAEAVAEDACCESKSPSFDDAKPDDEHACCGESAAAKPTSR